MAHTELVINSYDKAFVNFQIQTQISFKPYTCTFFGDEGDEYMFYKTFRRVHGETVMVKKLYQIIFDKEIDSFEFELVKK